MHKPTSQQPLHGRRRSISDPFAVLLQPPPNESQQEREGRLRAEQEAKKRSDNIDKMLRESDRRNRKKKVVKVLLLGQSESGKSTTLKQFQLLHTPAAFNAERVAWRFVIYLNLLRSIRRILDAILPELDAAPGGLDDLDDVDSAEQASIVISANGHASRAAAQHTRDSLATFERYSRQFAPLFELENRLLLQLSDPDEHMEQEPTHLPGQRSSNGLSYDSGPTFGGFAGSSSSTMSKSFTGAGAALSRITIPSTSTSTSLPTSPTSPTSLNEPSVKTSNWKKNFGMLIQSPKSNHGGEIMGWWEDPNDPVHLMNRFAPLMKQLWHDPLVRQKLIEKRIRLEESSGFYLDDIDRITAKMYFPTDEDVLKARLKTTGVNEHTFTINTSEFRGVDWKIYDVGGARHQRHAWAPYFDDVDAIIFLAPISAFDQVLAEDPSVNRLQDSLMLWQSVTMNKLLANVNIILFLNKCDLLKKKLQSGVKLRKHMTGYRDRPNDYESVSQYFRNKFGAIHQAYSPNKSRELYIHLTAVTDTPSTRTIILVVRDIILQGNLKSTALI